MRSSPRRRSRALDPIRGFLSLLIALDLIGLGASVFSWLTGGHTDVTFWLFSTDMNVPPLQPGNSPFRRFDAEAVLATVNNPSLSERVLEDLAGGTVWMVTTLVIAVLGRRLVDAATRSDPFTVEIARRVRRLGVVVLVGGALAQSIIIAAGMAVYHSAHRGGSPLIADFYSVYDSPDMRFGFWWLPLGFALVAFAAVVRHGCTLRAELDEVI